MEKIIEIDLINKDDLVEKYNKKNVSTKLINYIIKEAIFAKSYEKIQIIINKNCNIEDDAIQMIKKGLQEEYDRSIEKRNINNMKQLWLLALGIILLFLSTLIKQNNIWKEILLISGWVPIWEMVEVELFPDVEGRKKRKNIKKLLKSEMIERNVEIEEKTSLNS